MQNQEEVPRAKRWILLGIMVLVVMIDLAYFLFPNVEGVKGAALGMVMMALPVFFYFKPKFGLWAIVVGILYLVLQLTAVVLVDSGSRVIYS